MQELIRLNIPRHSAAFSTALVAITEAVRLQNPLVGKIPFRTISHSGPIRNVQGPQPLDQPLSLIQQILAIPNDVVRNSDIEAFLDIVYRFGEEMAAQVEASALNAMQEITEATGNLIDAGGKPLSLDMLNDMLEAYDISFDKDGEPELPTIIMNPDLAKRLAALHATPEQLERREQILQRKKAEHNAKKRYRRLSRENN